MQYILADSSTSYLSNKLVVGPGLTSTIGTNPDGSQNLTINPNVGGSLTIAPNGQIILKGDTISGSTAQPPPPLSIYSTNSLGQLEWLPYGQVRVNSTDTSPDFLANKIIGTNGVNITVANNQLSISLGNSANNFMFVPLNASSNPTADNQFTIGNSSYRWAAIYSVLFQGTSVQAEYADLAEKYTIEDEDKIEIGDVIIISDKEEFDGKKCDKDKSHLVIGVVSSNPAFVMNNNSKGIPITLRGRTYCKVIGPVRKGDSLVTTKNGCARSISKNYNKYVFAKALQTNLDENIKLVEVLL
jgi:hypothetical protein